jgi:hypothetical protein
MGGTFAVVWGACCLQIVLTVTLCQQKMIRLSVNSQNSVPGLHPKMKRFDNPQNYIFGA